MLNREVYTWGCVLYCWRTTTHIPWRIQYEKDERTRDTSKTIYLRDKIEDFSFYITPVLLRRVVVSIDR